MTAAWLERYRQMGYAVIPGFADAVTVAGLRRQATQWVSSFDPEAHPSVFRSGGSGPEVDRWFLESGDRIRCFLEPGSVDVEGRLQRPRELAVNKIGHALHELDPTFRGFSFSPSVARLARTLGMQDPRLIQSMVVFKQPGIGGQVDLHQDATFLYTEPQSAIGLWLALEDADRENGCLWVLPGGHRGPLRRRFRRDGSGSTEFVELDPSPMDEDALRPLEVKAGTLVLLHGLLPHASGENASPRSRMAYILHLIEGDAEYPQDNWLQRRLPAPRLSVSAQGSGGDGRHE